MQIHVFIIIYSSDFHKNPLVVLLVLQQKENKFIRLKMEERISILVPKYQPEIFQPVDIEWLKEYK